MARLWIRITLAGALGAAILAGAAPAGDAPAPAGPRLAPPPADFAAYLRAGRPQSVTRDGQALGLIPSPLDLSHMAGQRIFPRRDKRALPATYDLRGLGRVTPIRNQNPCGTCWAFATLGAIESSLLPGETWDFSENNIKNTAGFDPDGCYGGGNHLMALAYLARWSGPVAEADDPYNPYSSVSPGGLSPRKHIQRAVFIPDRSGPLDNDDIKQAVMDRGGVYTAMYYEEAALNDTTDAYYSSAKAAPNHAVVIVGWNDNYSRNNFSTVPPGDGAFIVRNSWGTGWGAAGYFHMSYYDATAGTDMCLYTGIDAVTNYAAIYQYDPLGATQMLGYGNTTGWAANVFTADGSEDLAAVSFYALSPNTDYDVYIYTGVTAGPTSGTQAAHLQGTAAEPGYLTLDLPAEVAVAAGSKFSVVVRVTTPGYNYPLAIEMPTPGYSGDATANAGESYVSSSGSTWTDITTSFPNTNTCIKAFTASGDTPPPPPDQVPMYGAHVASDATWWTRLTVVNVGDAATAVDFVAINEAGQEADSYTLSALAPGALYTRDVADIFSAPALAQGLWVQVNHEADLLGMLEFGTRDGLTHVTIPMFGAGSPELIFPYVIQNDTYYTGITLINVGSGPATVTLDAYNEDGGFLARRTVPIARLAKYVRLVAGIFDGITPATIRFIRVDSTQPLVGFELFGSFVDIGLAGMPPVYLGAAAPAPAAADAPAAANPYAVYYNHIPYPGDFYTGTTFSNLSSQQVTVLIELFDFNGTRLAQRYWPSPIRPLQQITREIWTACGLAQPDTDAAYMKVSATQPLMGFELFLKSTGDPADYLFDGIAGATAGAERLVFPVVKTGAGWHTNLLGLVNTGATSTGFTVHYYAADGGYLGYYQNFIPLRGKFYGYIDPADPGSANIAWLVVDASNPVVGDLLFIADDWTRMSAYLGLD
jgi:C1A family cysteine protease